jgi:hypothetical protein
LGMKERKLPYKGLTRALVAEAFPKLAASWWREDRSLLWVKLQSDSKSIWKKAVGFVRRDW